ncbi:MAG: GNAT family N-acetyltransferase [Oscillospiraceae bacterium]|nr:GNAT family N-acetyltransferase [Oscillospiraceae bacterium]
MLTRYIHTNAGHCYYELNKPVADGGTYLIYDLYVYFEYRRKGYARKMLQYLIDEIRSTGYQGDIYIKAEPRCDSISIANLVQFYTDMGLTVCGAKMDGAP